MRLDSLQISIWKTFHLIFFQQFLFVWYTVDSQHKQYLPSLFLSVILSLSLSLYLSLSLSSLLITCPHAIPFQYNIFSCPCLSIGFCAHLTIFSYNSTFTINWEGCIGFTIANKTFRDFFFPSYILINFFCKIKIEFMTAYNICTHIMLKGKERNLLDSDFLIQHFHFSSEFCSIEQFHSPTFCLIHA